METIKEPVGGPRPPQTVAMLVCDRIIRDTRSDRASLIDLLEEVSAATALEISVYARLTEALGTYTAVLDVVRRSDLAQVVMVPVGEFTATDPLEDGEILVHGIPLRLPSAGPYDVRLWMNGRFVQSVSLRALG